MGTNYYAIKRKPSLYNTPLHIGKSSGGWMFLFHGYQNYHFDNEFYYDETININSIEDWAEYLKNDNIVILNEYDEEIERLNEELNCYKFPSCKSDDIEVVSLNLVDMMRKNKRLELEIERLNKKAKEYEEEYLRIRHQYSELENKYLTDENIINELEDSIVGKINILYQVRGQSNAIQELGILLRHLRELKGDSSNERNV